MHEIERRVHCSYTLSPEARSIILVSSDALGIPMSAVVEEAVRMFWQREVAELSGALDEWRQGSESAEG